MNGRERILAVLAGTPCDRLPVWLMRQAGRFLPEYRAVRAQHSFLELVRRPDLCTEVALQPLRRFDLDATIVFSDILLVPDALGAGLAFTSGDGPRFERPVRTPEAVAALDVEGALDRLEFVYEAVAALRVAAPGHALFGFAGSPWTLFCYLVEGSGGDFHAPRTFLRRDPASAQRLLDILADLVAGHLARQHRAGADVVQVFDTWGGLLPAHEYERFCAPGLRRITAALGPIPSVLYVRSGSHLTPLCATLGFTALSVHETVDLGAVPGISQGNLDPTVLLAGESAIRAGVAQVAGELAGRRSHIHNLGHGILPGTPPEAVTTYVSAVREHG